MNIFNILDPALSIFGRHLVEASAGTGKTFAIEHLCLRLVINDVAINKILVMTFTKAATRELKMRIRTQLEQALQIALSEEKKECPEYLLAALENREQVIKKLQNALFLFDENQIYTIHGFCNRALSDFAFEAKIEFQENEKGYHHRCREALYAFFREELSKIAFSAQVEIGLRTMRQDIERFLEEVYAIASKKMEIDLPAFFDDPQMHFTSIMQNFPQGINRSKFLEDFHLLRDCYKKIDSKAENEFALIASLLESKAATRDTLNLLIRNGMKLIARFNEGNVKARKQLPPPEKLHYPGLIERIRKELCPLIHALSHPKLIFLYFAKEFQKKWNAVIEDEALFSYDEMLNKMHASLAIPSFVKQVQAQYEAVIIDEFQDTDSLQWEIFQTLFLKDNPAIKSICLVGDPKQSIYGFRNADLYTYLAASESLGKENKSYLDTNYRSEKALVDALNTLFSVDKGKEWLTLPSLDAALEYIPVKHRGKDRYPSLNDGRGALHCFMLHDEKELFPWMADEIHSLTSQGVKRGKIALLVRDRFMAKELQAYLKTRNIASMMKQTDSLTSTIEFQSMEAILRAVIHQDENAIKEALATPLIGFNHHDLKTAFLEGKKALCYLSDLFFEHGCARFFQHFLRMEFLPGQTVLHHLLTQEDLHSYMVVMQIIDLLLDSSLYLSEKENILLLIDQLKNEKLEENEKLKIGSIPDEEQVVIMTIHTSKGLEFEVVFAPGLLTRYEKDEEIVAVKKGCQKRIKLYDAEDRDSCLAISESNAEKMRLLYVAMTRAQRRLYIPYLFEEGQEQKEEAKLSPIELFFQKKLGDCSERSIISYFDEAHLSYSIDHHPQSEDSLCSSNDEIYPPSPFSFEYAPKSIVSFSSIKTHDVSSRVEKEAQELSLPGGAETGKKIHEIIELYLKRRGDLSAIIRDVVAYSDLEGCEEEIKSMMEQLLSYSFENENESFTLLDIAPDRMIQEMEFFFDDGTHLVKGYIDLVIEHRGKYYFLDWKSNVLDDYASLEKAMMENDYLLQGELYSKALIKYLSRFDERPFSDWFGGGYFVFLRGMGVYQYKLQEERLS